MVWDASIVLARYLIHQSEKDSKFLKDKNVLELGAGLGLCGMTAAVLGAKFVLLTDLSEAVPLLKHNIDKNNKKFNKESQVEVSTLTWSLEEAEKLVKDKTFDFVLVADCIYYEESINPLIETLNILTKNKKTVVVLSQELRESQKQIDIFKKFLKKARDTIIFREIPALEQDPEYQCEEIMLYSCTGK